MDYFINQSEVPLFVNGILIKLSGESAFMLMSLLGELLCLTTFTFIPLLYRVDIRKLMKCCAIPEEESIVNNQYIPQKMGSKGVDHVAIIVTIGNSWLFAEIFTAAGAYNERPQLTQFGCRTDRSGLITATRWISLLNQLQWGTPSFNAGDIFAMIAASLVAIVERSISLRNMLKLFWI
ncbi:nucleobase-ascorbate transporter 4-like isoform X2 [Vicia villosa]|uniref:nucleobase-ascorbate transporter 4-like isoform X2 n=1 Tax=Vicia villosa TaxID=3911 RepID=UPI00273A9467|nr:nucleobase-ascorbate transporter 4-like isoform X2 [Vicia villosa]XP_058735830.1 nucleobase-ascorbate transporter 4-like isoform X2 [Vicia villosa]XP_058735831.1 nucleobase-ascorbate transporter 4-like isoform X2 [Vicia villosa]